MVRSLLSCVCVCALGFLPLVGCTEGGGEGGTGGTAGTGGMGGGGSGGAPMCQEDEPCAFDIFGSVALFCDDSGDCVRECIAEDDSNCRNALCATGQSCNVATGMCEGGQDVPRGTPCSPFTTSVCNGSGDCVECLEDLHCDDFNDCTIDTCDSSLFQCNEPSLETDGTPCEGGTCQAGECALSGTVLPCSVQGVRNAIAAGGGPYTFDCDEPTTIEAWLVFDKSVILDGEGKLTVDGEPRTIDMISAETLPEVSVTLAGFGITGGSIGATINTNPNTTLTLLDSWVFAKGGIGNTGRMEIVRSAVYGSSQSGATLITNFGVMTVTNSTVSETGGGDAIFNGDIADLGILTLNSSTVSVVDEGGGRAIDTNGGMITSVNTIIDGDCRIGVGLQQTELLSGGHNIESPANTCDFEQPTDQVNVSADDLKLGPLADNGGPTMTHALLPGSVAIDHIPTIDCAVDEDQRGEPRPETGGDACDVGSFERQLEDP